MFPFPMQQEKVAVAIIDLQAGYCAIEGESADAVREMGWDTRPAHAVCERHLPFLAELRALLPASHIIWARMEEHENTLALNSPMRYMPNFDRLCVRGTPGHDYHLVHPSDGEVEVFKTHPSIFHKDACITSPGTSHEGNGVHEYLQSLGVDTLVFTGVVGTRCVNASVIGASILGYNTLYLTDLSGVPGGAAFEAEAAAHEISRKLFYAWDATGQEFLSILREEKPGVGMRGQT